MEPLSSQRYDGFPVKHLARKFGIGKDVPGSSYMVIRSDISIICIYK